MTRTNPQWRLAARPVGATTAETWAWRDEQVPEQPGLGDGELLVENRYVSLDPAMRGWLAETRSYIAPVAVGDVMRAMAAGRVLESRHPQFPAGAHVTGLFGVQRFAISNGLGAQIVDPDVAPLPVWLGALGLPGLTAWFGLTDVGKMKAGDTVVVSGAAGAVGSIAGQIAALSGCRAVGIAGGPAKCGWLRELGYAAAIDYKQPGLNLKHALRDAAPDGIDVYFDNVGGETLDAALARLRRGARVVLCGAISQYNSAGAWHGPANYFSLLVNRATMTGFVVLDYAARYAEGVRALVAWYAAGKLHTRATVIDGLDQFPRAFDALFAGENIGKLVLRLDS